MRKGVLLLIVLLSLAVSVSAEETCSLDIKSKTTDALLAEIPSIDELLQDCPVNLGSPLEKVFKNARVFFDIKSTNGFTLAIENGAITSLDIGKSGKLTHVVEMEKCALDTILSSEDKFGAFAYLSKNGKVKIYAKGFFKKFGFMFVKGGMNVAFGKAQKEVSLDCGVGTVSDAQAYDGYKTCEFYQVPYPGVNKKLATCGAFKAGDSFCVTVLTSKDAKAFKCGEDGEIICGLPCGALGSENLVRCPFDNDRKRGNQAPPLGACPVKKQPATNQASGKPSNCYETYMEGHREYQYGKKTWDQWKAETKGVCQTQTAEPPKGGNCVHLFEQIAGNDKKWLCWYN